MDLDQAPLQGAPEHALGEEPLEEAGEERQDVEPRGGHRRLTSAGA